ncbi:MAG: alternative thymidylate synthase-like protein [Acidobacteriales bacterium]|nr:alternative thymidylate synthase-like protein [Terriglobales bacterium]
MSTPKTTALNQTNASTPTSEKPAEPTVNVFAIHGAEPEVQAYAMAKYSRSALSMKESLKEISEQKAEQFLNTFYFQYGHRSIADLAHVAFAIEKLSLLAAISLVDEQRWDGQERSTRYQNFRKSGYHTPDFGDDAASLELYTDTAKFLFTEYEVFSEGMFRYLEARTPKPPEMDQASYDRTLKARAFDLSRYLLPLATNTSLGQIVNARTLETQIARLLSHTHAEVRTLGDLLKQAAREPAFNVTHTKMREVLERIRAVNPELADEVSPELLRDVRVSPTLVKYAVANKYEMETRRDLQQAARELMNGAPIAEVKSVELLDEDPLDIELAATLLYAQCHYPYKQLREAVASRDASERQEIIDIGLRHRGKHDELLRPFNAGQKFRFDVLMDVGGFRDMHRHRRCTQIEQGYTTAHGYDEPGELREAELHDRYRGAMKRAADAAANIAKGTAPEAEANSQYLLPLAYRKRCLFNMDFAEVLYISELRTTEAGHQSYREVAYSMFKATQKKYPELAKYFRVTDVHAPVDLLKR